MDNVVSILELLKKKKDVFLEVEKLTDQMLYAETDDLSGLLEERGRLLQTAVSTEDDIRLIASQNEEISSILNNSCDMSSLSDEMEKIYEASMRAKSIINRIKNNEADVRLRMERERDLILKKIESLNSSGNSVAESYKRAVQTGYPGSQFFSKNYIG